MLPMGLSTAAFAGNKLKAAPYKGPSREPIPPEMTGPRSLRAHGGARGLLVGCAVQVPKLLSETATSNEPAAQVDPTVQIAGSHRTYAELVKSQASIIVAENAMKWAALRPSPTLFYFNESDVLFNFASDNSQKVRGHNFVWHEAIPKWFAGTVNKSNARAMLKQHIETVAGRYAGQVHSWDVVNEVIDTKSGRPDGLRKSPWLDLVGDDYIEFAFRTANRVDPAARLTYNEYGIELDTPEDTAKRAQVLALVKKLKTRGVPIHAIGVQSHLEPGQPAGEGLQNFVREAAHMGLDVYITELDVNTRNIDGSVAELDKAVAETYSSYLNLMLAEPNVAAVLTWGITDRYTWLNRGNEVRKDGTPNRSLPFDSSYHPKTAFFAMRDAMDTALPPMMRSLASASDLETHILDKGDGSTPRN
jgi:endo-1,4-beta-xylanase